MIEKFKFVFLNWLLNNLIFLSAVVALLFQEHSLAAGFAISAFYFKLEDIRRNTEGGANINVLIPADAFKAIEPKEEGSKA